LGGKMRNIEEIINSNPFYCKSGKINVKKRTLFPASSFFIADFAAYLSVMQYKPPALDIQNMESYTKNEKKNK
ncbi:MAG: hypothetical protein KAJ63_10955, partial [Methyloprofundus sp.]|nr:hypothetical protein [Methyloprofundus sp.]